MVLTCPAGKYAEAVTTVRRGIRLEDLGISEVRPRRTLMGALVLEFPGADNEKADRLTSRLWELISRRG